MANEPSEGKWYEGSDGKPTRLELSEADLARLRAIKRGPMLDEIGLLLYPAGTWAAWFDGLGLHDLAERARTELAQYTNDGASMVQMMLGGQRPSRVPESRIEQRGIVMAGGYNALRDAMDIFLLDLELGPLYEKDNAQPVQASHERR
ncbi:hypothetical protein [Mycobacteroides abscessus]|uniref:hypothetical protein n=1 Tax=Mycobacteroides abscessus TaxID=36809 RepID=UPI0011C36755|nr:hypothetical protein [Mycobacteroides abscessus]